MKLLSKLLLIVIAAMIGSLSLSKNNTDAHAQTSSPVAMASPTTLDSAHFKSGYFKQNSQFEWHEFDQSGNIRFTFQEILRDENTVYLREDRHNVSVDINDAERVIYASWPGQARHVMHRITSATLAPPIAVSPPRVENPIAPAPPLTVRPPIAVAPPPVSNPIAPAPVAPTPSHVKSSTVTRAAFKGGVFEKSGDSWTATTDNGQSYNLVQLGYDKSNVYLLDTSRNGLFILDIPAKVIRVGKGDKIKRRHRVTEYSAGSLTPPTPEEPNFRRPLPEMEARLCRAKGGTVEQAGMLGHERCTMAYSDANMACTDSDQCQGQCRSMSQANNESNVIGQCQPTDNPFGCFTEVKNGKTEFGLCVD